jgi:hypothetical protein
MVQLETLLFSPADRNTYRDQASRSLLVAACCFVFSLVFTVASPVGADYLPENQSAEETLSGYERMKHFLESDAFVLSRLELRKHSGSPIEDLGQIANSKKNSKRIRRRAIRSLALYPNAIEQVEEMLSNTRPHRPLFEEVLLAYAQLSGEEGVETIDVYTAHRIQNVRMAAVMALGRFGGQTGYEKLLGIADAEESPKIQEIIRTYID